MKQKLIRKPQAVEAIFWEDKPTIDSDFCMTVYKFIAEHIGKDFGLHLEYGELVAFTGRQKLVFSKGKYLVKGRKGLFFIRTKEQMDEEYLPAIDYKDLFDLSVSNRKVNKIYLEAGSKSQKVLAEIPADHLFFSKKLF